MAATPSAADSTQVEPSRNERSAPATDEDATAPVVVDARYKGEVLAVASGGLRRGARYLDNLDLTVTADLDRLVGIPSTRAFVYGLYNNGTSFSSELAGDAQAVSNIETGVRAVRLYEAWIEHGDDALSLRAGLYDINSEFDALAASTVFINSAHGIGTDISQSGNNGPSIFPVTAPGLRLQGRVAPGLTLRAAVLDGTPGDPAHPARTVIGIHPRDGAFAIAEADWQVSAGRLLVGGWRYTARFAVQGVQDATLPGERGNEGAYIRGETRLAGTDERGVAAFARLGVAAGRFNVFDRFASAGVTVAAPLRADANGVLGLAVAHARTSAAARAATAGMTRSETAIELTYRTALTDRVSIQPDIQYVIDPSAMPDPRDALIVGVRFELRLRR